MSTEQKGLSSVERLLLAQSVNKLCEVKPGDTLEDKISLNEIGSIVSAFDPRLTVGSKYYAIYNKRGKSKSFGGLMSSSTGEFQGGVDGGSTNSMFAIGSTPEDRIGVYKVTKTDEGINSALTFHYFIDQIARGENIISQGPMTHILYDKENLSLKAIIKSHPMLTKFLGYKIVWYKPTNIWGSGKLRTVIVEAFR